jgi:hypothetical protein
LVLLEDLLANRVQQVRYDSLVSGDPLWIVDDVSYLLASAILLILGGAWVFARFLDRRHNLRAPRQFSYVSFSATDRPRVADMFDEKDTIDDLGFYVNEDERE